MPTDYFKECGGYTTRKMKVLACWVLISMATPPAKLILETVAENVTSSAVASPTQFRGSSQFVADIDISPAVAMNLLTNTLSVEKTLFSNSIGRGYFTENPDHRVTPKGYPNESSEMKSFQNSYMPFYNATTEYPSGLLNSLHSSRFSKGTTSVISEYSFEGNRGSIADISLTRDPIYQTSSVDLAQTESRDKLYSKTTERTLYTIAAEKCMGHELMSIMDTNGSVQVIMFNRIHLHYVDCVFRVAVPADMYLSLTIADDENFACKYDFYVGVFENGTDINSDLSLSTCYAGKNNVIYPKTTSAIVRFIPYKRGLLGTPWLTLHFEALPYPGNSYLPVRMTSPTSGYVTSSGYYTPSGFRLIPYAYHMSVIQEIWIPLHHVVMVSFPLLVIGKYLTTTCPPEDDDDKLKIMSLDEALAETVLPLACEEEVFPANIYRTGLILNFTTDGLFSSEGFRMLFSFLDDRLSEVNAGIRNGLWDCSGFGHDSFGFKQHLECNLELECQGGEDERDCPFSHPACDGSVGYKDRCYTLVTLSRSSDLIRWEEAYASCKARGGLLANLKTPGERKAIQDLFTYGKRRWFSYIGIRRRAHQTNPSLMQYRNLWSWSDETIAYDVNITEFKLMFVNRAEDIVPECAFISPFEFGKVFMWYCANLPVQKEYNALFKSFICELPNGVQYPIEWIELKKPTIMFPNTVIHCTDHVILGFLSCDSTPSTDWMPMFVCDNQRGSVHYSIVCDFWEDCQDGSDERFCVRENCLDCTCHNKQCVNSKDWCDGMRHCVDNSDERSCLMDGDSTSYDHFAFISVPPPVLIDLDGHGGISQIPMNDSQSCPETHFQCPGEYVYCLPVYVRCNGVFDCPGHEDEENCQIYICPGFYRCRASSVCVHPKHVCDGVFHCPRQDDEWMCGRNMDCPDGCRCQGLAFACTKPLSANAHPDLRYLDASGSGMTIDSLPYHFHLVHLRLTRCGLTTVTNISFPNLLVLDLSDNQLTFLDINTFLGLENLRSLNLAGNSLVTLTNSFVLSDVLNTNLRSVDFSRSEITQFNSKVLFQFYKVSTVNVSYSTLTSLGSESFRYLMNLESLDLRGSPIKEFPTDVFNGLSHLRYIWTDNFKLCCRATLPEGFDETGCFAPLDEISSCEDLLRSDMYRLCLWIFAVLSMVGNAGCFIIRLLHKKNAPKTGFSVFVTNLSVADILMGVYLVMIGAADSVYRGKYLWYETAWKQHPVCELAGFLSLVSKEVSALIICFITLDRFIVLRFPFSTLYFKRRLAIATCGIVWLLGVVLAAVPLMPGLTHWQFYSQTGICVPLPITRKSFQGRDYSFGVMIVLNFVLFLLVAAGQLVVYWSVRANVMTSDTSRKSQDMTVARRLLTVAVSDFLCWFPIGLLGLLASRGILISGEVNVGMAIFVLPLNSALNPFLYTFNMLMERRRKSQERNMMSWFEANILAKRNERNTEPAALHSDVDNVLKYIRERLDDMTLTYPEVLAHLNFASDD